MNVEEFNNAASALRYRVRARRDTIDAFSNPVYVFTLASPTRTVQKAITHHQFTRCATDPTDFILEDMTAALSLGYYWRPIQRAHDALTAGKPIPALLQGGPAHGRMFTTRNSRDLIVVPSAADSVAFKPSADTEAVEPFSFKRTVYRCTRLDAHHATDGRAVWIYEPA